MSTTAKFSLDNPFYEWPKNDEMDIQILLNRLNDLRAKISSKEIWKTEAVLEPNSLLRQLESKKLSVVFVCSNDLTHSVHVSHIPFLCRLTGTKLVVLKAGSAKELQTYFGKKNLFMFALSKHCDFTDFTAQFPDICPLNLESLPQANIKK